MYQWPAWSVTWSAWHENLDIEGWGRHTVDTIRVIHKSYKVVNQKWAYTVSSARALVFGNTFLYRKSTTMAYYCITKYRCTECVKWALAFRVSDTVMLFSVHLMAGNARWSEVKGEHTVDKISDTYERDKVITDDRCTQCVQLKPVYLVSPLLYR